MGNATRQQQQRLPSDPITPYYQVNHLIALEKGLLVRREGELEREGERGVLQGGLLHLSHAASSTFGFEHEFLLGFCYGFFLQFPTTSLVAFAAYKNRKHWQGKHTHTHRQSFHILGKH